MKESIMTRALRLDNIAGLQKAKTEIARFSVLVNPTRNLPLEERVTLARILIEIETLRRSWGTDPDPHQGAMLPGMTPPDVEGNGGSTSS